MPETKHTDCHPLIVDDDQDFVLLIQRCLEKSGIPLQQIRSCGDGEAAIALLSTDDWHPSFVLLDLNLPRRSGLEVLEWIRSTHTRLNTVPVFMFTSSPEADHAARAFHLGVGSYFIKPMDIHALKGVLEGIVTYWDGR